MSFCIDDVVIHISHNYNCSCPRTTCSLNVIIFVLFRFLKLLSLVVNMRNLQCRGTGVHFPVKTERHWICVQLLQSSKVALKSTPLPHIWQVWTHSHWLLPMDCLMRLPYGTDPSCGKVSTLWSELVSVDMVRESWKIFWVINCSKSEISLEDNSKISVVIWENH